MLNMRHTLNHPLNTNNQEQSMHPQPLPFRHRYGFYPRLQVTFTGPGRTKQSFKDECDINTLMAKYLKTGHMDHVNQALPRFESVSEVDFQSAQNLIADAKSMFENIPSAIRSRFDNEPGKLLDWVHDPKNVQEAASLGFLDLDKVPDHVHPTRSLKTAPEAPKPAE
ncbi:MAG: internal scaffolding protein [Arizlama microvirus]|nr:MAG: internal scaffolding protein [Arizlama microvirus]